MPIYEYYCKACQKKFSALRPMSKADAPIECEYCHSRRTSRQMSTFASHSGARSEAAADSSAGGGCGSCASHSCASCGVKR